jgi:hypothetical protein
MQLGARGWVVAMLLGACGDSSTDSWDPGTPGEPGCQDAGAVRLVGETWTNAANCTQCECVVGNTVECHVDPWPIPECPKLNDCPLADPVCVAGEWRCADTCEPCADLDPEPCPEPEPGGCLSGGAPVCSENGAVDRWLCEPFYCTCEEASPVCGVDENGCTEFLSCGPEGWECTGICSGTNCDATFPEGRADTIAIVLDACGCAESSPCEFACTERCAGAASAECDECLADMFWANYPCAAPLALYCTDECVLYTTCNYYQ